MGEGSYNDGPGGLTDGQRAFVLDASSLVPEPSGIALLSLASLALVRRTRPRAAATPGRDRADGATCIGGVYHF